MEELSNSKSDTPEVGRHSLTQSFLAKLLIFIIACMFIFTGYGIAEISWYITYP